MTTHGAGGAGMLLNVSDSHRHMAELLEAVVLHFDIARIAVSILTAREMAFRQVKRDVGNMAERSVFFIEELMATVDGSVGRHQEFRGRALAPAGLTARTCFGMRELSI